MVGWAGDGAATAWVYPHFLCLHSPAVHAAPAHIAPPPSRPPRPALPCCSNCRARLQQHNSRRRKVFAMSYELRTNRFVQQDNQLVDPADLPQPVATAAGLSWQQRQAAAAAAAVARPALPTGFSLQSELEMPGGVQPQHHPGDSSAAAFAAALAAAGGTLEGVAAEQQQQLQPQRQGRLAGEVTTACPSLCSQCCTTQRGHPRCLPTFCCPASSAMPGCPLPPMPCRPALCRHQTGPLRDGSLQSWRRRRRRQRSFQPASPL